MSNFTSYFEWVFTTISTFLTSEPIIWFVGGFVLLFVVKVFLTLIRFRDI